MISRSRRLARLLRVLVACVVLGVVGAPAAPAFAYGDVAGWVAGAGGEEAAERGAEDKAETLKLAAPPKSVPAGEG